MTPTTPYSVDFASVSPKEQPSRTYRLEPNGKRIIGFTDGLEAMKQAVLLILNTERFRHAIYSWNYGNEIGTALGEDFGLAQSNVKRYIKEALLQDERITDVDEFVFGKTARNTLVVSFTVSTIFGEIRTEVNL